MEWRTEALLDGLNSWVDSVRFYGDFVEEVRDVLVQSGAYLPSGLPDNRMVEPFWWDTDCELALGRRKLARRELLSCQTAEIR